MPANIGEMFYYGDIPWHGQGLPLKRPATMEEALRAGGLNWQVGEVDLQTCDDPPCHVEKRKALIRLDRQPGDPGRVLGVAHRGFQPLQNRDGAVLFDAIFGHGEPLYHTGGYLGKGEVVWLLAKIDKKMEIGKGDSVEPYALFANSHDGSRAFSISLTTVRVVCQNTLNIALKERGVGEHFRRSHGSSFREHSEAAQRFWATTMKELDDVTNAFTGLSKKKCDGNEFGKILERLLPFPARPRNSDQNPMLMRAWEKRRADIEVARKAISDLRKEGKGMNLEGAAGTFWGALSAITEFFDHHKEIKGSRISYALLGDGMDIKVKAFRLIQDMAEKKAA